MVFMSLRAEDLTTLTAKRSWAVWLASGFGVGFSPWAPGTLGSLLSLALWWPLAGHPAYMWVLMAAFAIGIPLCEKAAIDLGITDPPMVIWDEVIGMGVTLIAIGPHPLLVLAGFGLFRLFDILKPFPIRDMERFKGGYGIVMDDLVAGIYAGLCLHGIVWAIGGFPH